MKNEYPNSASIWKGCIKVVGALDDAVPIQERGSSHHSQQGYLTFHLPVVLYVLERKFSYTEAVKTVEEYFYVSRRISSFSKSNINGKYLSLNFLYIKESENVHLLFSITYPSVIGDKYSNMLFLSNILYY